MANRGELRALIEKALSTRSAQEWIPAINAAGVPCGPVLDLAQALNHPVTHGLDMVESVHHTTLGDMNVLGQAVKVSGSQDQWLHAHAPLLGEQTVEVLGELGYAPDEIGELLGQNVVVQAAAAAVTSPSAG